MKEKLRNVDWTFVLIMGGLITAAVVTVAIGGYRQYKIDDYWDKRPHWSDENRWD